MITTVDRVQRDLDVKGNTAEIGVHHGRLFLLLLLMCRESETGLAIDLFADQERNLDNSGKGNEAIFRANLRRYATGKTCRVHAGDSTLLTGPEVKRLAGGPVRIFSVDGGHTEGVTFSDLVTAQDSLVDEGVVILDDCFNEAWPDVASGVAKYMADPARQLVPFAVGGNKTLFCRPAYAAIYQEALRTLPDRQTSARMFGSPVISMHVNNSSVYVAFRQTRLWRSIKDTPVGERAKWAYDKVSSMVR
jgi:hypothetical protein